MRITNDDLDEALTAAFSAMADSLEAKNGDRLYAAVAAERARISAELTKMVRRCEDARDLVASELPAYAESLLGPRREG